MTASAATVEGLTGFGLPECELDQVHDCSPAGHAVEQANDETVVQGPAQLIRVRVHQVTVLSVIAAVQLTWIAALIYGLSLLL